MPKYIKKEGKRHDCLGLFGQAFLYALIDRKTTKKGNKLLHKLKFAYA